MDRIANEKVFNRARATFGPFEELLITATKRKLTDLVAHVEFSMEL